MHTTIENGISLYSHKTGCSGNYRYYLRLCFPEPVMLGTKSHTLR